MFHARWVVFGYALALSAWTGVGAVAAPVGTAFTYQGQLKQDGAPENGNFNMEFRLFDAAVLGNQIGNPVALIGVPVSNGLFTVTLNDAGQFGSNAFNGDARWLQITVDGTPLSPRQKITAAPYAVHALNAPNGHSLDAADGSPINAVYVDNDGNVGIGTTNPTTALNLSGAETSTVVNAFSGSPESTLRIHNNDLTANNFSSLAFSTSASNAGSFEAAKIAAVNVNHNISSLAGDLAFLTRSTGGLSEKMRVLSNGNVGIGDASPLATFTVGNGDKFQVSGTNGDVTFTDDLASITFPATDATNAPMIHMFASGTTNGNRMVLAHSPAFTNWGLQYEDASDKFHFLRAGTAAMTVDLGSSRVGIGTSSPGADLDISSDSTNLTTLNLRNTSADQRYLLQVVGPAHGGAAREGNFEIWATTTGMNRLVFTGTPEGRAGIGTIDPAVQLHVEGGSDTALGGGGYLVLGPTTGANISIDDNEIMARNNGQTSTLYLNNNGGTVRVPVLEITGADLAEKFPVSEGAEPGMVVAIDPDHAGQLRVARGAYNRRVAGVVSGANGLATGAILGNLPGHENAPPIALSGRVWVYCDTSNGAIQPGDLLTTSDTPGHAMKATDHAKAQGAVLGKAMTSLQLGGTGLVLVLVSLQ